MKALAHWLMNAHWNEMFLKFWFKNSARQLTLHLTRTMLWKISVILAAELSLFFVKLVKQTRWQLAHFIMTNNKSTNSKYNLNKLKSESQLKESDNRCRFFCNFSWISFWNNLKSRKFADDYGWFKIPVKSRSCLSANTHERYFKFYLLSLKAWKFFSCSSKSFQNTCLLNVWIVYVRINAQHKNFMEVRLCTQCMSYR